MTSVGDIPASEMTCRELAVIMAMNGIAANPYTVEKMANGAAMLHGADADARSRCISYQIALTSVETADAVITRLDAEKT